MKGPIGVGLAFLLAVSLSFSSGYIKQWNKISNWGNPSNWDKGRLPCLGDTIVLADGAVFIDQSITVSELELAANGEISLDEGNEMAFADAASQINNNCPGQPITFLGGLPKEWVNPLNWDRIEGGIKSRHTDGMLYTDRVPCTFDRVTFPPDDAFSTRITEDVTVSSIQVGSGNLSDTETQTYFGTLRGKQRFKFASGRSLTVTGLTCNLPQGCTCGTQQMKNAICGAFACPPACANRVTPVGDCCDRCGALIRMHTSQGFELGGCEAELRQSISNAGFGNVLLAISPLESSTSSEVQILFTDSAQGANSMTIGKKVFQDLTKPPANSKCLGYGLVFFPSASGGGGQKDDDDRSTIALAVVLTVVVLLIILVLVFFVWRRSRRGSFGPKRAVLHNENNVAGVQELDYVDTEFNEGADPGYAKGESFQNPVYNEMGYPASGAVAAPLPAKTPLHSAYAIDNPTYENEIDFEAGSDATVAAGRDNPLYNDLYDEKKPPPDDDDEQELEDDEPEMMKAKLKIELGDEDHTPNGKGGGKDSEA